MSTKTADDVRKQGSDRGDDLDHWYCCNENLALCGADITNATETEDLPDLCIVCDDLEKRACERCGE